MLLTKPLCYRCCIARRDPQKAIDATVNSYYRSKERCELNLSATNWTSMYELNLYATN